MPKIQITPTQNDYFSTMLIDHLCTFGMIFLYIAVFFYLVSLVNHTNIRYIDKENLKSKKPIVIPPKRVKLELKNTNSLLNDSIMTASTAEQLVFTDSAKQQVMTSEIVIAAFEREKTIDLTVANERLKKLLNTVESSVLQEIK